MVPPEGAVRLGIIGTGLAVKWIHWPVLRQLPGYFKPVMVCDIDPAAAQATAQRAAEELDSPGCLWTTDYKELLSNSEIEAVLIALPIQLTSQVIIEAAKAGKHVLAEKPLAADLNQANELVRTLSEFEHPIIEIAENFHYRTDFQKAQEWIKAGRIGDPFLIELTSRHWTDVTKGFGTTPWRQTNQYGGGVLADAAVHHAAGLRELGGEIARLQAFVTSVHPVMEGPDTLNLNVQFRSGALGTLLFSGAVKTTTPKYLDAAIYGSKGEIKITWGKITLGVNEAENEKPQVVEEISLTPLDMGYLGEFQNFYEAIRLGAPVISTVEEARRDFEIIMQALNSAENGTIVPL